MPSSRQHLLCGLPICNFHGPEAPRLYISELTDGCGHRLVNVIDGLAFAKKHGMNFGGVLRNMHDPIKSSMGAHGHEFGQVVDDYFGKGSAAELLLDPAVRARLHLQKLRGNWEIESFLQHIRLSKNVYIFVTLMQNKVLAPPSTYFTTDFQEVLKSSLGPWQIKFAPNRPSVALHLRRGDLKDSNPLVTKDAFYFKIVEQIQRLLPSADVHVFSSTEGVWQPSDFDGYRDRGMEVHLDDENLVEPLAHFSRADVFVMAKSTFSYSASLANLNCVVYHGDKIVAFPSFRDRVLPGWVDGDRLQRGDAAQLEGCLKRVGIGGRRPAP